MELDEGLATKLWLEEYENQGAVIPSDHFHYHSHLSKLHKNELESIALFLKQKHIRWDILIHTAWGLLLNRFSSSDFIIYATSQLHSHRSNMLKIHQPITPVKSIVNEKTSIKTLLNRVKLQLQKKNHAKQRAPEECRYLLLFKPDKKNSKFSPDHPLLISEADLNQFPLILCAEKKPSGQLTFFYHPSLFSQKSIDSIARHLIIILREISNDIHQKAVKMNILTNEEKKTILHWGKPQYQFPFPDVQGCAHTLFMQQAKQNPDALAVKHNTVQVTYGELDTVSTNLAAYLLGKGLEPGDPVCVLMDRTPTLLMTMLAIFKAGAIYVPINPKYPPERIDYVLDDSQAKCILVNDQEKLHEKYRSKSITVSQSWQPLHWEIKNKPPLPPENPEQLAYIIYTSGTTGKPKGVMIRHKSLTNLVTWYRGCFNVTKNDRSAQFASQGFDTFLCETIPYLTTGASVHIVDDNTKLTPSLFFSWLEQHQITICDLPTAYALMLFTMKWPKTVNLRIVKIGGESVTHYPTQTLPFDIWNGYGPTETTIECTYVKIYEAHSSAQNTHKHFPPPIGKPIIHTEAYIVDKYLQPVPIGVCGELLIGGVGISAGYLNRHQLTEEKFIPHILSDDKTKKLYRTGDLVRWLSDGKLEFIGRIDHQVKIRGYRIELGDIEYALSQHTDVNEVVVLAKENLNGEKSLIAYVVPNLDKERYLYQERCLLSTNNNKFIEAVTEDISKEGLALSGVTEPINIGSLVQIHLKLPGMAEGKLFSGHIIWQQDNRCGIAFDLNDEERKIVSKSIDYYLSTHNVMELVLSTSAKRSLRKALKNQLPEYMVPSVFVTLLQFPLTFSGKIDVKALPPPQDYEQILQKEYVPPKTETEKKLAEIWSKVLHKNRISMTDDFFDLGANSLKAAELSVCILNEFNQSIPAKILFDLPYIPVLANYIDTKGKLYASPSLIQEEIRRDCTLHENILPSKQLSPSLTKPQNILLTGGGGFLGIYLLRELLKQSEAKIYCLIRKGEFETAAKRLISTIDKFNLSAEISLANRRIVAIASDLSFDNFGLPLEQYNSLIDKVDLIYHCGAQVNIMSAYHKLRGSNVQGTLEVIKFATSHIDKPIHYISSLSAACRRDATNALAEDFPSDNYDELFGGYAISKWVSERLLTEINKRGLPTTIYRSGYISGQSDTGITSLNDALLMLIKGCIQLGLAPDMNEKITILPVDFVSEAIVKIALAEPAASTVYHIDHPTGILWTDLVSWLNDYGYKIKIIPMSKWQSMLINISHDNALFPFLPYYLAMREGEIAPEVSTQKASAKLKELGLTYPKIDEKLLTIYFDYLCQVSFLPPPKESDKTSFSTSIKMD
ncbi:non-ribosomal peptide synthetase [Aquicella lusitana]|uniref:Amino acid adenylation domain-containing protein/thioester reductase-like protein n=1 Tax=Aquicella lusitana TaxID=254246 RepID=A0A370GRS5_9COXI|nr:non-ribosomal peptide synthetase [Aquicella lusitana]RDI46030.1 amino acid adenylation domain-containing protein/thioester reductase-like protein [Aquicella lusitana]VVC73373.1 Linear gramicidin synthase subunit B [Aquicella lusitana]